MTVSWKETPGVEYWIFAAPNNPNLTLSTWLATTGSTYRLKVTSPFVVTGLTNGTPYSFFMTGRINSGPGGAATPTVTATPRLAGTTWTAGTNLNTGTKTVSYTHLRAHETTLHLVCRLLLEKKIFLMIRRPPRSTLD